MSFIPTECPKCRGRMQQGFVFDFMGEHGRMVSKWMQGAPSKSFWLGVKMDDALMLPIGSYRCQTCGFLEHFARSEFEPS